MTSYNISEFKTLVGKTAQASSPEVRLALSRVSTEAKERMLDASSASGAFFGALRQALGRLKGNGNAELRIACLMDCAHYFYVHGDTFEGIAAAQDAVELSKRVRDDFRLRKAQTGLAILLADSGSIAQAIETHVATFELAKRISDRTGQLSSLINLGVALLYGSQFDEAVRCWGHAEELLDMDSPERPRIFANKALSFLRQGRILEGLQAAEKSIVDLEADVSADQLLAGIVREFIYLQLLLESGDLRACRERAAKIELLAHKAQSRRAGVIARISKGLVEISNGDVSRGLDLLVSAESETLEGSEMHQDALIALVQGYEEIGRYQDALRILQRLMQHVRAKMEQVALWQVRSGTTRIPGKFRKQAALRPLKEREVILRVKVAEAELIGQQIEMLERLAVTADLREEATGEHGYRVGRLSGLLAEEAGMDTTVCAAIDLAARLHDIGKIGVPDRILLTSKELKEAERHFMCQHTIIGAELLAKSNITQLKLAEDIALYHHEWWDGSGYPKKIAGKRIPMHARIVALADMFDALTHGRPYAEPWSMERALEEIRNRRGTQFDPDLTDRFIVLVHKLRASHENLDEFLGRAGRNSPFLQARRKIKLMLEEEREHERRNALPGNETRH